MLHKTRLHQGALEEVMGEDPLLTLERLGKDPLFLPRPASPMQADVGD